MALQCASMKFCIAQRLAKLVCALICLFPPRCELTEDSFLRNESLGLLCETLSSPCAGLTNETALIGKFTDSFHLCPCQLNLGRGRGHWGRVEGKV